MRIRHKKLFFLLFILIVLFTTSGCNFLDRLRQVHPGAGNTPNAINKPSVEPGLGAERPLPGREDPDNPGEDPDHQGDGRGESIDEPFPEDPPPPLQEWPDTENNKYEISAVYPDLSPLQGGRRIIVKGALFSNKSQVVIAGKRVASRFDGGKLIAYTPPQLNPGVVDVEVLDPLRGSVKLERALTYYQPFFIQEVRPGKIPARGGGKLFIEGKGFTPDTVVTIGESEALMTTYVDENHLVVTPPPYLGSELSAQSSSVSVPITITSKYESSRFADRLSYVASVRVTHVEPVEVEQAGGSLVTLRGSGFTQNMRVKLGRSVGAPWLTVDSCSADGTLATFTTPPHSKGYTDLFVETPVDSTRLANALYFSDSSVTPRQLGPIYLTPRFGSAAGGTIIRMTGPGIGFQDDEVVEVGGVPARIVKHGPGWIEAETPPSKSGNDTPLDVPITVTIPGLGGAAEQRVSAEHSFSYLSEMSIVSLKPSLGSIAGGETLALKGSYLTGVTNVLLGGVPVPFRLVDDSTIELTTLPHRVGFADLVVKKNDYELVLPDFFRFVSEFNFYAVRPTEGSVTGGTVVELLGEGFTKATTVKFGEFPAKVTYVSDRKIYAVAPKHAAGSVDLTVVDPSGKEKRIPEGFLYEENAGTTAGSSGGPIEGAVNVTVYSSSGRLIKGAVVLLSTRKDSRYKGVTDDSGSVTISGRDLFGEQTISVTAYGYGANTVQGVNARNVKVILDLRQGYVEMPDGGVLPAIEIPDFNEIPNLPHGGGGGGGGSEEIGDKRVVLSDPVIKGQLYGLDKIGFPNEHQSIRAYIFTSRTEPNVENPAPGPRSVLTKSGPYQITTRVGDLALIALGGIYDHSTGEFTPLVMGIKRFLTTSLGQTLNVDLTLDIPLNTTMRVKFPHVPSVLPDRRLTHWIHLGFDGYFRTVPPIVTTDSTVELSHQPNIERDLPGASYFFDARAYSGYPNALPISVSYLENVTKQSSLIELPGLFPVVNIANEGGLNFGEGSDRTIYFTLDDPNVEPDFFYIRIARGSETIWRVLLPGTARSFQLPDFPELSSFAPPSEVSASGAGRSPEPYPDGDFVMRIFAIKQIHFNFNALNYERLLSGNNLIGYSYTAVPISFNSP